MTIMTRRRLETRALGFEPEPWSGEPPAKRRTLFAVGFAAASAVLLLCSAWWATDAKPLVASERREGGRVLACQYLAGKRVVERQYLVAAHGSEQQACPLFRFD